MYSLSSCFSPAGVFLPEFFQLQCVKRVKKFKCNEVMRFLSFKWENIVASILLSSLLAPSSLFL